MLIIYFILGISMGSFLHVVAYRVPKGVYFSSKYSYCHSCKKRLMPCELIPIFSYLIQKGRCKGCLEKISFLHPFSEFICGILFVFCFVKYDDPIELVFSMLFISLIYILIYTDVHYYLLPNSFLMSLFLLVFIWQLYNPFISFQNRLLTMLFSIILLGIIIIITKGGMGGGDYKLFSILAYFFGFSLFIRLILYSSLFAIVFFYCRKIIYLFMNKKLIEVNYIYFGPFIGIATYMLLFLSR